MKRTIYSGLNTKCLILTATVVEQNPYNEFVAKKTMEWFIQNTVGNYFGMVSQQFNDMIHNVNPILAETRQITHNNQDYFLNTYIVSYKMPEKTNREILNSLFNRSMRGVKFPSEDGIVYPKIGIFKCIYGDGTYTSKMVTDASLEYAEEWQSWFVYQGQNQNKHNHAVLGFSTDAIGYNKYIGVDHYYYGTLPQYQIEVCIYENSADAINEKEGFWFKTAHLSTPSQDYGIARNIPRCKLNAFIHKGTLVVSDNVNGITSIKDKLLANDIIMNSADVVTVNQYSLIGQNNGNILALSTGSGINHNTTKYTAITLMLMNKDRIIEAIPNTRRNGIIEGNIQYAKNTKYAKNKRQKSQFRVFVGRQFDQMYGIGDNWSFIIPFEKDKEIHIEAMDLLYRFLTLRDDDEIEEAKTKYFYSILLNEDKSIKDDVLMDWFRKCSATAKSDEEKLREAYNALKEGLVKEYQDIEKYLSANNFNDKKPIPAIRLEEEFSHSPLNKLGFDFETEVISTISYTRLDRAVENKYISLKYMIPWVDRRGEKGFVKGRVPLSRFYDKTNNMVVLNSNKIMLEHMERMVR